MESEAMKTASVLNAGNPYRLLKAFDKARRGEPITYVSLGGSITAGAKATARPKCYAALVAAWLKERFGDANVNFVNAGIGATGSLIGVHRTARDVLAYRPDLVIVEYDVNDNAAPYADVTYDNLLNRLLNSETKPAVLALGMPTQSGTSALERHLPAALYYDVPFVSFRSALEPGLADGSINWNDLYADNVHPNDAGHALCASLITSFLAGLLDRPVSGEDTPEKPCFTENVYTSSQIYYLSDLAPDSKGCFAPVKTGIGSMPDGWRAVENGAPLTFTVKNCRRLHILYRRTNEGVGGKAVIDVNGVKTTLDSDFPNGWGVYAPFAPVWDSAEPADLTITVTPELEAGKQFTFIALLPA